jgi:hypothetical protein
MKQVWLWANPKEWAACCRPHHATLPLFERDGFHTHGAQACDQERRAEPPTDDLAVYLVGRLVDSQFFEHSRKLFVTDATPNHLCFYQLLRSVLPSLIWLLRLATLARRSVHHYPSAVKRPLLISYRYLLMAIFGRIRPTPTPLHYTFSTGHFYEDELLRKTLGTPSRARQLRVAFLVSAATQLPSAGGAK